MQIGICLQHDEYYPEGEYRYIANNRDIGKVDDDEIYYYVDDSVDLSKLKVGEKIQLDEVFTILDLEGEKRSWPKHYIDVLDNDYCQSCEKDFEDGQIIYLYEGDIYCSEECIIENCGHISTFDKSKIKEVELRIGR